MEICRQCQTEVIERSIVFGRVGKILMTCCEHEATQIALKYENTGPADHKRDLVQEDL